jgi:hypothetical protein
MPTGYLQGEVTTVTTQQKIADLKAADQETSGLSSTVISPNSAQGQNLPTNQNANAQPVPKSIITNITDNTVASPLGATNNIQLDRSINLGVGGTATIQASTFEVRYTDVNKVPKIFTFSLLPAIETNLRSSHHGATVPEVKPGILVRTSMNYKRFSLPGGSPVFQSLGIEQTIIQLVGLFVGTEGSTFNSPDSALYGRYGDSLKLTSANKYAEQFDREIVKAGREVTLFINSQTTDPRDGLTLTYKCCIQTFRVFIARFDRVYYSIDAVLTDYPVNRIAAPTIQAPQTSTPSTTSTTTSTSQPRIEERPSNSPQSNPNPVLSISNE